MSKSTASNPNALFANRVNSKSANVTSYEAKGNISNENIVTTRDRAALVFHEYVRHREWTTDWLAYASIIVGLLVPIFTSDFKGLIIGGNVLVSGGVCKGFVLFLCFASFLGCAYCLFRRIKYRKELKCDYFLEQLRKDTVNVD